MSNNVDEFIDSMRQICAARMMTCALCEYRYLFQDEKGCWHDRCFKDDVVHYISYQAEPQAWIKKILIREEMGDNDGT